MEITTAEAEHNYVLYSLLFLEEVSNKKHNITNYKIVIHNESPVENIDIL